MSHSNPFRYFKTSHEIIRLAVMMYVRFPLSLRNVEDLLHERGIEVSHETVRYWWNRFGPLFAGEIRRRRAQRLRAFPQWQWHLYEIFVQINGVAHYLWRAVDHEGEVLEAFVSKRRDRNAALRFLRRAMKRYGCPKAIVTDRLRSYGAALKDLVLQERQRTGRDGSTIAPRTHTYPYDDGSGPCSGSGKCEASRSSPPFTPRFTITSTRTVISTTEAPSNKPDPLLLPSGGGW